VPQPLRMVNLPGDQERAAELLLFVLIARWYWSPRLAPLSLRDALTPLLLLHLTRTLGLTVLPPA
jgi:hypothetical protein